MSEAQDLEALSSPMDERSRDWTRIGELCFLWLRRARKPYMWRRWLWR